MFIRSGGPNRWLCEAYGFNTQLKVLNQLL